MSSRPFRRQITPLSIALLGLIAAITGYQAGAYRPEAPVAAQAAPCAIATFDLEKTFNTLEEKKAADAELTRTAEEMKKQSDEQAKRLKAMETELQDLQPGTPRYKEVMEQASRASYEYQAQVEFFRAKLDSERAKMMHKVYESIRTAAEQMAKERGLVAVLVDDSITPIPPGTEEEINRQISARRMVYTSPDVDVTDELISRMNALFKVAGAAAGNKQ
jgi:Skp family chaperone for outer membrane proteins